MNPDDPGPKRFQDWKDYAKAAQKASDADFLVTPWEEPNYVKLSKLPRADESWSPILTALRDGDYFDDG